MSRFFLKKLTTLEIGNGCNFIAVLQGPSSLKALHITYIKEVI